MKTFIWLVKRELWEHRTFWLVPLVITVLLVLAYIAGIVFTWVHGVNISVNGQSGVALAAAHPEDVRKSVTVFYTALTALFNIVLIIMMIRYLLHCLYEDRRDRSILFWRSLPVSDTLAVLSKLAVVMIVAPLTTFVLLLLAQLIGTGALSAIAARAGLDATSMVWGRSGLTGVWAYLVVGFLVQSLWYLPFYGWLLMASAWARRAPVLWAAVPVLIGGVVEGILFQTHFFLTAVGHHATSVVPGFDLHVTGNSTGFHMHGAHGFIFHNLAVTLGSAGLWIGVGFGSIFVATAIIIRRYRAEDY